MNYRKSAISVLLLLSTLYSFSQENNLSYISLNWSPDGTKLVYSAIDNSKTINLKPGTFKPQFNIYQVNADGSGNELLVEGGAFPSYSPDGKRIVYVTANRDSSGIYVFDLKSHTITPITHAPGVYIGPRFSPSGKNICYCAGPGKIMNLFICNSEGTNIIQLTADTIRNYNPVWNERAPSILFFYKEKGDRKDQIYSINTNSKKEQNLINDILHNYFPEYSRHLNRVIFTRDNKGNRSIFSMDENGNDKKPIYTEIANPHFTQESPDGKKVASVVISSVTLDRKAKMATNLIIENSDTGKTIYLSK